jgi:hypothetical protein
MADQNRNNSQHQAASSTTGRRNLQQQEQGANRPLPAVATSRALVPVDTTPVTTGEKIKYTAVGGIGSGALAGLLGMHSFSAFVAVGVGITAWTFADSIRAKMQEGSMPNPLENRPGWMTWEWWNTPQPIQQAASVPLANRNDLVHLIDHEAEQEDDLGDDAVDNDALVLEDEEEDALFELGRVIKTRRRLDPPINALLGKGAVIMGSQGTGKSNIVGLIAQCAGNKNVGMPTLIIDYKGEFHTLCTVFTNGIIAGHPSYAQETRLGFFPLTVESAPQLAQIIMEGPFQVVLDTTTYNGDNDLVAQVIAALLHSLMDWSRAMRRAGKDPWPCLVITDEAHNFLPQKQTLSALAMQKPKESFGVLTSAYSRMANTGRSYGYTLVMATQRLPNIAKWAIANLQIKVVLAHAEKNDLDACEEETGGMVDREEIKRLAQGTGIVIGFTKEPVIVKFDKQKAQHVSNTPKVEDVRARFKDASQPRLSGVLAQQPAASKPQSAQAPPVMTPPAAPAREMKEQLAVMLWSPAATQQSQSNTPRQLYPVPTDEPSPDLIVEAAEPETASVVGSEKQQVEAQVGSSRRATSQISDTDFARAFAYHMQGHNSYRKLYRYANPRHGWSEQKCRDLMELMKKRGLIEQQGEDCEQS